MIDEVKDQLQKRLEESYWEKIKNTFSGSTAELFEGLDELLEDTETENKFVSILGIKTVEVGEREEISRAEQKGAEVEVNVGVCNPVGR